jgi:hypothetical protein
LNNKKTILILIPHYLPGFKSGGPVTSIKNIVESLSDYYDFKILTFDRDLNSKLIYENVKINQWNIFNGYSVFYIPQNIYSFLNLIITIRKSKFDYIYLNSFFHPLFSIYIIFLSFFRILRPKKIIISSRGEFFDEALGFKSFKKKYYLKFVNFFNLYKSIFFHATDEKEKFQILKYLNIKSEQIRVAMVIPDMSSDNKNLVSNSTYLNENNNTLKIVWLARISKDKNFPFVFDILANINFDLIFDIYGPIEDPEIWDICNKKIQTISSLIKVNYKGELNPVFVKSVLRNYDLFILPTFAENYGHSISESISVGTPVLISDNTPWRNLSDLEVGWDFNLNNINAFVNVIYELAKLTKEDKIKNRLKIVEKYNQIIDLSRVLEDNKNLFKF